ncbi:hypothetical protein MNBD_GAMMA07-1408 [hydrothermal vent metagenome]|uniref:DUF3144 domain-containing protein n=1 Tax=hydrothermal vent metagenome TaxID=652676 RepID=A0A3B0WYZ9_9ZZZZ
MTNTDQDQLLRKLADSFINVANEHAETQDKNIINTAFMYAASRFCAYVAASSARNLEDYQNKQKQGVAFFTGEFQRMLESNMQNHEKVFGSDETLRYEEFMKKN